jgi:hypothetical protein
VEVTAQLGGGWSASAVASLVSALCRGSAGEAAAECCATGATGGRSKFSRSASLGPVVRPFELALDSTKSLRSGTKMSGAPTANAGSLEEILPFTAERLLMKLMIERGVGREVHLSLTTIFMVLRTMNFTLPEREPLGYRAMHESVRGLMELSG